VPDKDAPTKRVIAVPSDRPGGLEASRSGHFGHCDCHTIVTIEGDAVTSVEVVASPPHTEGGCLGPVERLASVGVTEIVVGGIGGRPLAHFAEFDIDVLYDPVSPLVKEAVEAALAGRLQQMTLQQTCGGGGGGCSH